MSRDGNLEYDYIVVGGGSAGSILGARLSEGGDKVLLLEAGADKHVLPYDLPFLAAKLFSFKANNWSYESVPQKGMNGRTQFFPRGKLLGGSFIFNGAQYIRGNPSDFDHWQQLGNPGWGYEDVLPYFRKSEDYRAKPSRYHGTEGRLPVTKPRVVNPLTEVYLKACAEAGYPLNQDFNGESQDGFGLYDFNIVDGRRMTTARAFLRPAMQRQNLNVLTQTLVRRIILRDGRAVGVEFERAGKVETALARREIVLAAGSFNSPKLLMLSGIGDPDTLSPHGIAVAQALKGVGRNMQDHVNVSVAHEAKEPISFARSLRIQRLALEMLNGFALKKGQMTQSPLEAGGFFSSREGVAAPEFQAVFIPWFPAEGLRLWMPWADPLAGHSFVVHVWPNRPESRGRMWLASNDPKAPPVFDPNFLADEGDLALTRHAIRETRRIFAQPAFDRVRGKEMAPGADVRSDAELDHYIRSHSGIGHHTCGTAKMGQDDMAVVDAQLRVHGVRGLRVADASIMPTMVSGNTNAATIMIAEKAADLMLKAS